MDLNKIQKGFLAAWKAFCIDMFSNLLKTVQIEVSLPIFWRVMYRWIEKIKVCLGVPDQILSAEVQVTLFGSRSLISSYMIKVCIGNIFQRTLFQSKNHLPGKKPGLFRVKRLLSACEDKEDSTPSVKLLERNLIPQQDLYSLAFLVAYALVNQHLCKTCSNSLIFKGG